MKITNRSQRVGSLVLVFAAGALSASAQSPCNEWDGGLFGRPGPSGKVEKLAIFDVGDGPALALAGPFDTAGQISARNIAGWDGTEFFALGPGIDTVFAMAAFDDGSGPALFVGHSNSGHISKWDGSSFTTVGGGVSSAVRCLAVFDDGGGAALYAGGGFTTAGGLPANYLARWDGSSWAAVGSGVNGSVHSLAVHDDGSGPSLYLGGSFTTAGGVPASRLARWDGSAFSALGSGASTTIRVLVSANVGDGPFLYIGGSFSSIGGVSASNVAKWDGSTFAPLSSGTSLEVNALAAFDDGAGTALYLGGRFTTAGGVPAARVARWDGTSFSALGVGANGPVESLCASGSGPGSVLWVGGSLGSAGGLHASNLAAWNGSAWSVPAVGTDAPVSALAEHGDLSSRSLILGGTFSRVGGVAANHVAEWNGTGFSPLESGTDGPVSALLSFDEGGFEALYVGGRFDTAGGVPASGLARWDGAAFAPLGSGLNFGASVSSLAVHDDGSGPALYAAGLFTTAGGVPANSIAKWNGASWSPLGGGFGGPIYQSVSALASYDDGSGSALYAGGLFTHADGNPVRHIARWDGVSWSEVAGGVSDAGEAIDPSVFALTVFDDGSGAALYVGGRFQRAGSIPVQNVARYSGSGWEALGGGLRGDRGDYSVVLSLLPHDDGSGMALYAGCELDGPGTPTAIRRWIDSTWSRVASGIGGRVECLASFDDGFGSALFAGGEFATAGGRPSSRVARWGPRLYREGNVDTGSGGPPVNVLFADGSAGDPVCRRVTASRHVPVSVSLIRPPAGGSGHYVFWVLDGEPGSRDATNVRYASGGGGIHEIGLGARCLPSNNLVAPGSCPCPTTFPLGRTSRALGAVNAARLCVNAAPGYPRAPTSFPITFPSGTYTLGALIVDPNSPNAKPVSIANWIVIDVP